MIYLFGGQKKLIADTIYCKFPKDANNKIKIGSLTTIDIEKIVKLKPDLIVVTPMLNINQYKLLKKLHIKVLVYPQLKTYKAIADFFIKLSKYFNKTKIAKKIIKNADIKIKKYSKLLKTKKKYKVFFQFGAKPLFTVTKDNFLNDMLKMANLINISENSKSGIYSTEQVVFNNPDFIFITTMGIQGSKEKSNWLKLKNINAVKNNKIFIVDQYKYCSPTPIVFTDALKELILLIHPDLKSKLNYE